MAYGELAVIVYNDNLPNTNQERDKPLHLSEEGVEQSSKLESNEIPSISIEEKNTKGLEAQLNTEELIDAVSLILRDLIEAKCLNFVHADEIPIKTSFHTKDQPSISIKDYISRFVQYTKCQDIILIYMLIYLDRIGQNLASFTVDSFNVHKLLLISLSSASKYCEDIFFSNTFYASVGGISVQEFNKLELQYLADYLQFVMYVKPEISEQYLEDVTAYYKNSINQAVKDC